MLDQIAASPLIRILILVLVFAVAVQVSVVLLSYFERRLVTRGQLREIAASGNSVRTESALRARSDGIWAKLVERIERTGLSLEDTKADVLRDKLRAAGFASPLAPRLYTFIRLVLVLALPTLFVMLLVAGGGPVSLAKMYFGGMFAAVLGLYVPALFVRARADRRREAVTNGFPDCLDLLLICVEAGLGLEAALDRVAREMALSHPLVAELLLTATLRLRVGATREEALRRMADDAGIDEIRSFATLLIQSDRLGTSIGTTLRTYAGEMRERRRMRAEEKAHRLPVLLSIPLVACMLPTMIGVLMLPAVIRVVRQLLPALSGG